MNSSKIIKKEDFAFSSSTGKWLFQKIKFPLSILFWLTFLACYFNALIRFNIRTNFNQNNPGHGEFNWFLGKHDFFILKNSQWYLELLFLLLIFFVATLMLNIVCRYLQDYCENLSKNWLRKLIIYRCLQASPTAIETNRARINNVIFYSVPALSFYFINIPIKFFENLVKISFELYFLFFFLSSKIEKGLKSLALGFNLIVILAFLGYILLTAELQKQKKWEKLQRSQTERQQIQLTLTSLTWQGNNSEESKKKQARIAKIFQLFDRNLKKNKSYFLQKIVFDLPTLIIPGLNVIFYFLYYRHSASNFADAFIVYLLSLSIQSIFWKFRSLFKQVRSYNKAYAYYKEFNS